ncbi:hypothetical protein [Actinophytocola sp.]|uniref:hypothetical protein n=1 Tax=Actinophytocola sp. TaxID=1872138 RepID=UPI002ED3362B
MRGMIAAMNLDQEDFLPATKPSMLSRFGEAARWVFAGSVAYGLDWYDMLGIVSGPQGAA